MNKFNKIFEDMAKIQDRSIIWNNFLDYCIDVNLLNSKERNLDFKGNEENYSEMLSEWLLQLNKDLETKPYSDMLGVFYEELVTSHAKSKSVGQFFTPQDVTDLMVDLVIDDLKQGTFAYDCACGSARMLLSSHVKSNGELYCIGQDLDEVSCKMAVLNFWSHGVRGSILHQNSITLEFYQAWRVNNYLYHGLPIPHIELVNERNAYNFVDASAYNFNAVELNPVKKTGTVQSTLM